MCGPVPRSGGVMRYCIAFALFLLVQFSSFPLAAEEPAALKPAGGDKCPVCGMFVAKYPDFLAQIVFKDGSYSFFDGVKDMMKFYFNLAKYNPSKTTADIERIFVTDYYSLKPIDAKTAYYVVGCDVYGPMGKELIPVENTSAAKELTDDHKCTATLEFGGITPDVVAGLD
jgi:nitrous oxide reductase accessory protein NosL